MLAEGLVWDRRKVKSELEADGTRTLPMDTEKEPTRIHVERCPHPKFPKWELPDTKPKREDKQGKQIDHSIKAAEDYIHTNRRIL